MAIDIDTSFRQMNHIVEWIQKWFEENGKGCNAVIGISGGKDSAIVAALCVKALGKDRVIGIQMPNGVQKDISDADDIIEYLGIKHYETNIDEAFESIVDSIAEQFSSHDDITSQTVINLPPRLRMAVLYAYSQSLNGRVANTCNLSETFVGYETIFGDAAGDFAPLKEYTVEETIGIGRALRLPDKFILKAPADGLCDKTDEDNLGVTYADIDKYIKMESAEIPYDDEFMKSDTAQRIYDLNRASKFKRDKLNIPGPTYITK